MALILRQGDLFASQAPAVAHGCNCQGLMGAGIANAFRKVYPQMYIEYKAMCYANQFRPGGFFPWKAPSGPWIYNLASQDLPGPHAKPAWLRESLMGATVHAVAMGLPLIALPRIGTGIGGLNWELEALPMIAQVAGASPALDLVVYSL